MDILSAIIIICVIILLICLSAFFSSAETALTAASDARMRQLSRKGSKRAQMVEKLRNNRERLIGAILVGNNAVNVLASAIATSVAISFAGENGVVLATIFMTVLLVLFAEVLPKSYAINHADEFALRIAYPIRILVWLLIPVTAAIRIIAVSILGRRKKIIDREEELRGLIRLHAEDTADEESRETGAMLSSVLDLGDITVEEIMTHRAAVTSLNITDKPEDILSFILKSPHTRHPLYSESPENIVGVLHVKDLLRQLHSQTESETLDIDVAKIATEPYFVPETTQLFAQLQAFRSRREHFAIVVDEYGDLRGIVTLEDILEEIVGEIDDEHDVDLAGLTPQPDGSYIVDGTVTIRDINRALDLELPDDQASTIAGLVLYESRYIPRVGQEFIFHKMGFRIRKRKHNQITSLRIWKQNGSATTQNQ